MTWVGSPSAFPPSWVWLPQPSELVKNLGFQTDNMFSPSSQCTEAANKARWLIFIGFHPLMRGLSASAPQIWYDSLFSKSRCRYQQPKAKSKISYKGGNWHWSPPLRRETKAAGASFFAAAATTSGLLIGILIRTFFSSLPLDAA